MVHEQAEEQRRVEGPDRVAEVRQAVRTFSKGGWLRCPGTRKCLLIRDDLTCLGSESSVSEGTSRVQGTGTRPKVVVIGGARGVVGHAGTRLLADLADKTGLTRGFVEAGTSIV
jgi:hypothetical protein